MFRRSTQNLQLLRILYSRTNEKLNRHVCHVTTKISYKKPMCLCRVLVSLLWRQFVLHSPMFPCKVDVAQAEVLELFADEPTNKAYKKNLNSRAQLPHHNHLSLKITF